MAAAGGGASSEGQIVLFDDVFSVTAINPEGKKFDKVNRLKMKADTYEADINLDVASELFPVREGEKIKVTLTRTLRPDGKEEDDGWVYSEKESLLDSADYAMFGKVFKYDYTSGSRVSIYASFGGLLMLLASEQRVLQHITLGKKIYCLLKRT